MENPSAQPSSDLTKEALVSICEASGMTLDIQTSRTVLAGGLDHFNSAVSRRVVALRDGIGPGWLCAYGIVEPGRNGTSDLIIWGRMYHTSLNDFSLWLGGWQSVPLYGDPASQSSAA